jgi:hypothetical protein
LVVVDWIFKKDYIIDSLIILELVMAMENKKIFFMKGDKK